VHAPAHVEQQQKVQRFRLVVEVSNRLGRLFVEDFEIIPGEIGNHAARWVGDGYVDFDQRHAGAEGRGLGG